MVDDSKNKNDKTPEIDIARGPTSRDMMYEGTPPLVSPGEVDKIPEPKPSYPPGKYVRTVNEKQVLSQLKLLAGITIKDTANVEQDSILLLAAHLRELSFEASIPLVEIAMIQLRNKLILLKNNTDPLKGKICNNLLCAYAKLGRYKAALSIPDTYFTEEQWESLKKETSVLEANFNRIKNMVDGKLNKKDI